jgi:hypothetical protein
MKLISLSSIRKSFITIHLKGKINPKELELTIGENQMILNGE